MYYDKRVFSEDDVKSLDTMLTKGKVSFPFDNGWYLNAFYAANGCTIFGDGTDKAAGYDFSGDKAVAVTNYIVDLFANPNFVMDNNEGSLGANMQRWKIAPDWDVKLTDDLRFNGWLSMYKFANPPAGR